MNELAAILAVIIVVLTLLIFPLLKKLRHLDRMVDALQNERERLHAANHELAERNAHFHNRAARAEWERDDALTKLRAALQGNYSAGPW